MAYESERFDGIGLVLDEQFGLFGLDLDDCVADDGSIAPWAREIMDQFDGAYWEYSVSGTGLRGFCRGSLPGDSARTRIEGCSVDIYSARRFLVVTGQVIRSVSKLPNLQSAIDSLYATFTPRPLRKQGSMVVTGLKGRCRPDAPATQQLIDAALVGPRGRRMRNIWSRRDPQATDVSEDDWELANELTYQAIRQGYDGEVLARIVEQAMRAGPYRQKWDERRNGGTWLAMIISRAIQKKQTDDRERTVFETMSDEHVSEENVNNTVSGRAVSESTLQAENARLRALVDAQQTIIQVHQAEARQRTAIEAENRARVVATEAVRRNSALSRAERELGIVLARLVESARSRGDDHVRVHYPDLAQQVGISQRTVNRCMKTLADSDGAPFVKQTTTELRIVADPATGRQVLRPTSVAHVSLRADGSPLAALAAYRLDRRKHGGRRLRSQTRSERAAAGAQRPTQPPESPHSALSFTEDPPPPVDGDTYGYQDGTVGEQNELSVALTSGCGRRHQPRQRRQRGYPNERAGKVSAGATRRTCDRSRAATRARQTSAAARVAAPDQRRPQRPRSRPITDKGSANLGDAPSLPPTPLADTSGRAHGLRAVMADCGARHEVLVTKRLDDLKLDARMAERIAHEGHQRGQPGAT